MYIFFFKLPLLNCSGTNKNQRICIWSNKNVLGFLFELQSLLYYYNNNYYGIKFIFKF